MQFGYFDDRAKEFVITLRGKSYQWFIYRALEVFDGGEKMPVGREAIPLGMNRNVMIRSSDDLLSICVPENLATVGRYTHLD